MENIALPSSPVGTLARPSATRFPELPVYVILFSVTACLAAAALVGPANLGLPLRGVIALLVVVAAALAVFWRPAIFPLGAYFFAIPFDNMSQTGAGTITAMLAGASGAVALLVLAHDRRRRVAPPLGSLAGWLSFIVWGVLSLAWSIYYPESIRWITQLSELFVIFAIFAMFRVREDEVRVLCWSIVAGGVACSLYGLWLYYTGRFLASSGVDQTRLNIDFGKSGSINPDHFAGQLVLPIALTLGMLLRQRGVGRFLGWGAVVVMFLGIYAVATRGALIAIGAGVIYMLLFARRGRLQLLAITGAGLLASLAMPSVWLRFADPSQGAGDGRFDIWIIAWHAFRDRWLLGAGAGDFRSAYTQAYFNTSVPDNAAPVVQDAHNMLMSSSVELGVVGLVLLLVAWWFQLRTVSSIDRSSPLHDLRLAAEAGMIGLCITALTLDVLNFKYLWIGFMIAVLIRNADLCRRESSSPVRAPG